MIRAAFLAFLALSIAGCAFARTSVPYAPARGTQREDWNAARAACARDGLVPVQLYQWAVVRQEAALSCEPLGEIAAGLAR